MLMLKSRNMMVVTALLFLFVVIMLRASGGLLEDNIARVVGSIFGGSAETIPVFEPDVSSIAWLNPTGWEPSGWLTKINDWAHNVVDSILPAFIHTFNVASASILMTARQNVIGLIAQYGTATTFIAVVF